MSERPIPQDGKKSRSGSERRKRYVLNTFRSTEEERAEMKANAAAAGLAFGSFMRSLGLTHQPRTRAVRRAPPADVQLLARVMAQFGRVGGNLAQLLKLANRGEIVVPNDLDPVLKDVRALVTEAQKALRG
jgi:hypothetical protein